MNLLSNATTSTSTFDIVWNHSTSTNYVRAGVASVKCWYKIYMRVMALQNTSDEIYSTMSQWKQKKNAYNVDNKLTKVMGTNSFLPVLATALHCHFMCVCAWTRIYVWLCVPYKNGHKLWKTIILNKKWEREWKTKKKLRRGSIVKREVKRQFFLYFILFTAFFVVVVVFVIADVVITRKIIMLPNIFPWNIGPCNFILCVSVLCYVLFFSASFFSHSILKIKHSWWWCLSLQKLWAAKTYLLCACDAFNDFNECIYHKMKRNQPTHTHTGRTPMNTHILFV